MSFGHSQRPVAVVYLVLEARERVRYRSIADHERGGNTGAREAACEKWCDRRVQECHRPELCKPKWGEMDR